MKIELSAAQVELLCQVVEDALRRAKANYEGASHNLRLRPDTIRSRRRFYEELAALDRAMPSVLYGC